VVCLCVLEHPCDPPPVRLQVMRGHTKHGTPPVSSSGPRHAVTGGQPVPCAARTSGPAPYRSDSAGACLYATFHLIASSRKPTLRLAPHPPRCPSLTAAQLPGLHATSAPAAACSAAFDHPASPRTCTRRPHSRPHVFTLHTSPTAEASPHRLRPACRPRGIDMSPDWIVRVLAA
jgi:hypothetical protein